RRVAGSRCSRLGSFHAPSRKHATRRSREVARTFVTKKIDAIRARCPVGGNRLASAPVAKDRRTVTGAARVWVVAAGLAVMAATAPVAAAGSDAHADAEALLQHGVELRRQGRDREALEEFQHAAAIKRTPRAVAQIGMAEVALG